MIKIDEVFEFSNNDTIVIGCSSGPDSMSLVDMLLKVREKYNLQLVVAHVNHNVRKESYEEAKKVLENERKNKPEHEKIGKQIATTKAKILIILSYFEKALKMLIERAVL